MYYEDQEKMSLTDKLDTQIKARASCHKEMKSFHHFSRKKEHCEQNFEIEKVD